MKALETDFHHDIKLEMDEATLMFPNIPQRRLAKALEETGAIPLQTHRLIEGTTKRRTLF